MIEIGRGIQPNIDEARAIKKGAVSFMEALLNDCEVMFMTQMKESREKYDKLLEEAKLEAEKILVADAPILYLIS
jgi:hypothetical protein